jgi:hypothetical protein
MTMDNEDARAQAKRRELIRALLQGSDRVVLRAHPHMGVPGFTVYADHLEGFVYVCTLTTEPLSLSEKVDADIMTMDAASDPASVVRAWLSREFPGASLDHVHVELYEGLNIELTSCGFVGDEGCIDPTCWQCHSPVGPTNLRALAKNLAIAAMLCRAWQLGWTVGSDPRMDDGAPEWRPGCGSEAP